MTYDDIFEHLDMAYAYLVTWFYDLFDFINGNKFVSAAVIITFAVPSLVLIFDFIFYISSDSFIPLSSFIRKNINTKDKKDSLNKYQKAYLRSLKFDKKNNIDK